MSFSHMLLLALIAIIVIPPDKLPDVAKQVARFLGDMRRMTSGIWDDIRQDAVLKPEDLMKHAEQKQQQNQNLEDNSVNVPSSTVEVSSSSELNHVAQENQNAENNETEKKQIT